MAREWDEQKHPRDDDGKFAEKGGGSNTKADSKLISEMPEKEKPIANTIIPSENIIMSERLTKAKTLDDLSSYVRDEWGVKTVNLDGVDVNAVKGTYGTMEKIFNEYPELKGHITEIGMLKEGIMSIGMERNGDLKLFFNPYYYKDIDIVKERYAKHVELRNFPKGTDWKNAGVHELGHIAHGVIAKKNYNDAWMASLDFEDHTTTKKIVDEAWKNIGKNYPKNTRPKNARLAISGYAGDSYSETIAEAFSDVFSNGNSAQPLSIEIVRLLKMGIR